MPACSLKKALIAGSCFLLSINLFAQTVSNPEMPEMPSMPSMPTLGGTFYTPSFPSSPVAPKKNAAKTDSVDSVSASVLTNTNDTDEVVASMLTNNSILSASDISSLYDSGLFDNLSSLTSLSSSNTSSVSTNALLQQILTSLDELKKQQNQASVAAKNDLQNVQTDSQTFKQREPQILRFKINGYDIKDTLSAVFFSEPEADGTFLLTADRKYFTNQKSRTETFYILFKAVKSNGSVTTFKLEPSVVQDYLNENSFVYKFSKSKGLTAEKTGNLVVLHSSDNDLNVDLLLDIDK